MSGEVVSLSVEETNALRAKLGLKPLKEDDETQAPGNSNIDNDIKVAPVVPGADREQEELRRKIATAKERRERTRKLQAVSTLGEAEEEVDDLQAWVKRSRSGAKVKKQQEAEAARRARAQAELDTAAEAYTERDLQGMRVKHDTVAFADGSTTILTLDDRNVLDEASGDTLVNVNEVDRERAKQRIEEAKKRPYSGMDEAQDDPLGLAAGRAPRVLDKYDNVDVVTGDVRAREGKSFVIGQDASGEPEKTEEELVRERLANTESLIVPERDQGTDFYTQAEMSTFKRKKKGHRKVRKKARTVKADDLLPLPADSAQGSAAAHGSRHRRERGAAAAPSRSAGEPGGSDGAGMAVDPPEGPVGRETRLGRAAVVDEDAVLDGTWGAGEGEEDGLESVGVALALERARRAARERKSAKQRQEQLLAEAQQAVGAPAEAGGASQGVVFSSMSEFVRNVGAEEDGDEAASARAGKQAALEAEEAARKAAAAAAAEAAAEEEAAALDDAAAEARNAWQPAQPAGSEAVAAREVEEEGGEEVGEDAGAAQGDGASFGEEKSVGSSLAAALMLAQRKGFLAPKAKEAPKPKPEPTGGDPRDSRRGSRDRRDDRRDDRYADRRGDRDRGRAGGPPADPLKMQSYTPSFKLEYKDSRGRVLTTKEAFNEMSYVFHGKGSGKNKTDKKLKRLAQEEQMKKMTSEDTPSGVVSSMQRRMKDGGTAHIVLSGPGAGFQMPLAKKKAGKESGDRKKKSGGRK